MECRVFWFKIKQCNTFVTGDKERILIGTDKGEVLVLEGTDIKATLTTDHNTSIESILTYAKV